MIIWCFWGINAASSVSFCLFHQYKVMVDRNMLSPYSELMYAIWCRRYPPFAYLHLSGSKSAASSFRSISQKRRSQQCWRSQTAPPHCHSKRTSFPHRSLTITKKTWAHLERGNGVTVINIWSQKAALAAQKVKTCTIVVFYSTCAPSRFTFEFRIRWRKASLVTWCRRKPHSVHLHTQHFGIKLGLR